MGCEASAEVVPGGDSDQLERIEHQGRLLAVILRSGFRQSGIHFFTPGSFSQQLGYMQHPQGHVIAPHVHNPVMREVEFTNEVLLLRSGRLRVDFYTDEQTYLESRVLEGGDVVLLAQGGHGFEMLEPCELIEVKQGPYAGDQDKTRFEGIAAAQAVLPADPP